MEWKVAMVVVLFPVSDAEPSLERPALEQLARLGITSIALLRDETLTGAVLEGWAFDLHDATRAARTLWGIRDGLQVLQPLVHMAVSPEAAASGDRKE
jgi:hypothetical protein